MREIIFRGKRVDNGEWVKGFYACVLDTHYIITGRFDSLTNGIINSEAYKVDPSTASQFTGLTDRNGVKIFEGDIVKYTDWWAEWSGAVKYDSADAEFIVQLTDNDIEYFSNLYCGNCEVIGNIYDNPELLEVSE
mgnify:CR=1 FL=1